MPPLSAPRRIEPADVLADFTCGYPSLDDWLTRTALRAERERTATTYVVTADARVVGYYSLAAHSVVRDSIGGGRLARNAPTEVPAVLLARLAVDVSWQGHQIGSSLLAHAVTVTRSVSSMIGIRALVVDPIDVAAAKFYAKYGFRSFPSPTTTRMFYPI